MNRPAADSENSAAPRRTARQPPGRYRLDQLRPVHARGQGGAAVTQRRRSAALNVREYPAAQFLLENGLRCKALMYCSSVQLVPRAASTGHRKCSGKKSDLLGAMAGTGRVSLHRYPRSGARVIVCPRDLQYLRAAARALDASVNRNSN
jgi:hypothetical protein